MRATVPAAVEALAEKGTQASATDPAFQGPRAAGRYPGRVRAALLGLIPLPRARARTRRGVASPPITYVVEPPAAGSWTLRVEERIERAASPRLVAPELDADPPALVLVATGEARLLRRAGGAWLAPSCAERCTLRYQVDLQALASACRGFECPRRVGDALLGTAARWMVRPDVLDDATIHITAGGDHVARFATGLRRDGDGGYTLHGRELREASYTAIGGFRRAHVEFPGAALDVVFLGPPLQMGDEAVLAWIRRAAGCVASLYGRFPADATVFVVPVPRADRVVFGRVLSLAGASVLLLFGYQTPADAVGSDWVVVHELSHLGPPSFVGQGHWLEEGLATYYEPILRERSGWMRPEDLWGHFVREMPRGLRKRGEPPSLEERDEIDSTYWGGALFAPLASVRRSIEGGGAPH